MIWLFNGSVLVIGCYVFTCVCYVVVNYWLCIGCVCVLVIGYAVAIGYVLVVSVLRVRYFK